MLLGKVFAAAVAGVLCISSAAYGQVDRAPADPPARVPLRLGPVALAPAVTVTNFGWDSNVFHRQVDADPPSDVTGTVRPDVRAWLRVGRVRVHGRSTFDFVYFQDHQSERSVDAGHQVRVDLPLARVTPYVSGSWLRARQRFGFEIDQRTRRHVQTGIAGAILRVGNRTDLDVAARRSRLEFHHGGVLDPLVSNFYDHSSEGVSVALRQALTPLTSVAVAVERRQDRFDLRPSRDSNSVRISSGVEFRPFALITGSAHVGWRRVEFVQPGRAPFTGIVASVDLAYTLLGATRFAVEAERDLSYSAMHGQHAFLLSGVTGSVSRRLGGSWDIGGRTGRHRLSYGLFGLLQEPGSASPVGDSPGTREIITQYGGNVGYRVGPDTRIAFELLRYHRRSTIGAGREYERTRAGMSLSYEF